MSRNLAQKICKTFSFHVSTYRIISRKLLTNHFLHSSVFSRFAVGDHLCPARAGVGPGGFWQILTLTDLAPPVKFGSGEDFLGFLATVICLVWIVAFGSLASLVICLASWWRGFGPRRFWLWRILLRVYNLAPVKIFSASWRWGFAWCGSWLLGTARKAVIRWGRSGVSVNSA